MTVGILGLGLIGGSIAKAYRGCGGWKILAWDIDGTLLDFCRLSGLVDDTLTDDSAGECDLVILATFPRASIDYLEHIAPLVKKGAYVIDCLGVKREICSRGFELAEKYGFTFVGGHPMAGSHNSGFKFSRADLYAGSHMIVCPPRFDDMELLERVSELLSPLQFGKLTVTTADKHDEMIAFTSQLTHMISSAYVKRPNASEHRDYAAGSYRDMSRVAWLNPEMWTELFLENRDKLINEMDIFIGHIMEYRDALEKGDRDKMRRLLEDGRRRKSEIDAK